MKQNKPNFVIIGAAKSGTTSLFDYLTQHPDIYVPEIKECKYFSYDGDYEGPGSERMNARLIKSSEDYYQLFQNRSESLLGDISADYIFYHEKVIPRIVKDLGTDIKVIAILRNPVDRAYSAYLHKVRDLLETLTFEEALNEEAKRIRNNWEFLWYYKTAGLYSEAIAHYASVFPHFKVFLFDDLKKDPKKVTKELFQILEVDEEIEIEYTIKNFSGVPKSKHLQSVLRSNSEVKKWILSLIPKTIRTKAKDYLLKRNLSKQKMNVETRAELARFFTDDINKLEKIINRDLSKWLM
ncbi:MAG: sulfotransferase [Reichenbachiella sp.]|uniref:sulfotransferase family protein n=1 Tax=Reichenbachiella sp. TaxID=2184521 RepID=UPI00329A1D01